MVFQTIATSIGVGIFFFLKDTKLFIKEMINEKRLILKILLQCSKAIGVGG